MADYSPVYAGGVEPFTLTTDAAVTGGRVLAVTAGGAVQHAGTQSPHVVGVAAHDAAAGARVTVWPLEGVIHELEAAGAVSAQGAVAAAASGEVEAAAAGAAATAGSLQTVIGIALTDAATAADKVRVLGRR